MRHVCAFMIASIVLCAQGAEAQTILRVDCTASDPAPDGSTWSKAYVHLQDALTAASGIAAPGSPVQIWVAACAYMPDGAYTPPAGIHTPGSGDQVATFQLADDVEIYGGFPSGGGDGTFDARDPAVHITTLSGDLNADDVGGFETVVASDDWASATPITEGRTVFDTTDATIWVPGDGIDGQDVWFLYTASCTGTLAIRGTFGFGVAVYEESFGLPGALLASDDAGYVPFSVDVTATNSYLIRVGAANEKSGPGFIDLTCESDNTGDNSAHVVTGGGTNTGSTPNLLPATCHGVTFAGNSPSKSTTRSPACHGKQIAMSVTPRVVFVVSAISSGRAPTSRASSALSTPRCSYQRENASTPLRAYDSRTSAITRRTGRDGGEIAE